MNVKLESSWLEVLSSEFDKPYFHELVDFVKSEYKSNPGAIFPSGSSIFRAFDACPFEKVKVLIIGQDPYPTRGHAHGLSFSVESGVRPLPKSLKNIFIELKDDLNIDKENGDLTSWAEQGVLLLNAVLTVREGSPGSHANKGWEKFTDAVIRALAQEKRNVVYVLWGSHAQQKAMHVNEQENFIIRTPHPSPLSAYRGFFSSKPFSKTNQYLASHGLDPVKW